MGTHAVRLGSDPETVRNAQRTLGEAARWLAALATEGDAAVATLRWSGGDADEVRLVWLALRATFDEVAASTIAVAALLADQAAEQDAASVGIP